MGWQSFSRDQNTFVRWMSYVYYSEDGKFAGCEPVELLYIPYKYKCWGKGVK